MPRRFGVPAPTDWCGEPGPCQEDLGSPLGMAHNHFDFIPCQESLGSHPQFQDPAPQQEGSGSLLQHMSGLCGDSDHFQEGPRYHPSSGWPVGRSCYFPGGPRVLPLLRAASIVTTSCARRARGTTLSSGQPARSPRPAPEGPQIPLLIQATWHRDPTPTGWPGVWAPDQTAWCGNTTYHQRGPKFFSMLEPASKGTPPLARRARGPAFCSAGWHNDTTPWGRAWVSIPGSTLLAQ